MTEGSIEVVRMGQRVRLDGTTVWVLIFRRVGGDPCADCWVGRIVGGGPDYGDVAHFDAESLRAFKILIPDW